MSALIEVSEVSKVFGPDLRASLAMLTTGATREEVLTRTQGIVALNRVSFSVAEGEILVVMGLSGSGKSTLLRCLNRLVEPSSGRITVRGQDVTRMGARALREFRRQSFGMVFQHFALLPHRTIMGNVEFGLEMQGLDRTRRRDAAMAALDLVGLRGWEDKHPSELSGGMQQRAGLARALAANADVLLMDEAFSALDPLIRRDMQGELVALQSRLRKTVVFVTHDLDEAIALGGRIVLMKDGGIVQVGSAEEILTRPATAYVERFVAHIDVSSVLRVASLVQPGASYHADSDAANLVAELVARGQDGVHLLDDEGRLVGHAGLDALRRVHQGGRTAVHAAAPCAQIAANLTIRAALPVIAAEAGPVAVVDDAGLLLGTIDRVAVLHALARTRPNPSQQEAESWTGPSRASPSTISAMQPSIG